MCIALNFHFTSLSCLISHNHSKHASPISIWRIGYTQDLPSRSYLPSSTASKQIVPLQITGAVIVVVVAIVILSFPLSVLVSGDSHNEANACRLTPAVARARPMTVVSYNPRQLQQVDEQIFCICVSYLYIHICIYCFFVFILRQY